MLRFGSHRFGSNRATHLKSPKNGLWLPWQVVFKLEINLSRRTCYCATLPRKTVDPWPVGTIIALNNKRELKYWNILNFRFLQGLGTKWFTWCNLDLCTLPCLFGPESLTKGSIGRNRKRVQILMSAAVSVCSHRVFQWAEILQTLLSPQGRQDIQIPQTRIKLFCLLTSLGPGSLAMPTNYSNLIMIYEQCSSHSVQGQATPGLWAWCHNQTTWFGLDPFPLGPGLTSPSWKYLCIVPETKFFSSTDWGHDKELCKEFVQAWKQRFVLGITLSGCEKVPRVKSAQDPFHSLVVHVKRVQDPKVSLSSCLCGKVPRYLLTCLFTQTIVETKAPSDSPATWKNTSPVQNHWRKETDTTTDVILLHFRTRENDHEKWIVQQPTRSALWNLDWSLCLGLNFSICPTTRKWAEKAPHSSSQCILRNPAWFAKDRVQYLWKRTEICERRNIAEGRNNRVWLQSDFVCVSQLMLQLGPGVYCKFVTLQLLLLSLYWAFQLGSSLIFCFERHFNS